VSDLSRIALALGGEVAGDGVLAPGPGHGPRDRSLSVKPNPTARDGFIVFSFANDDWRRCRDHVRSKLGLPHDGWKREREPYRAAPKVKAAPEPSLCQEAKREQTNWRVARWLWSRGKPAAFTIAEVYLREARGYGGVIQPTLRFFPPHDGNDPALMVAFGLCTEPEPGVLAIADDAVMAVQLVDLKPDGSGKADRDPNKNIIGRGALGSPIVVAPPNDLLGLAITEGVEDAVSVFEATGLGVWASGGATRMPALAATVPDYIACVNIFGDDDEAGRRGATELAERVRARGFEIILKFLGARAST
jgi:hypothetical protein